MASSFRIGPALLATSFALVSAPRLLAVYDTKTGLNYESTSELIARNDREVKDWGAQVSGAYMPKFDNPLSTYKPDTGPSYAERLEAYNRAREQRLAAEKAQQEQWERERVEEANRRLLEAEFAQEAAKAREQEAYWKAEELRAVERPWAAAQARCEKQGRPFHLSLEQFQAFYKDLSAWDKSADKDPDAATRYGLAMLHGTCGLRYQPLLAMRYFEKAHEPYLKGLAAYFSARDDIMNPASKEEDLQNARRWRHEAWLSWKSEYMQERHPAAQRRLAVCLLALSLTETRPPASSPELKTAIARLLHRTLAAQRTVLASHSQPLTGDPANELLWLDAGTARVLWDTFAAHPEFAPCAESKADLRRVLDEAVDVYSRDPLVLPSADLPEWNASGSLPAVGAHADSLATLTLAAAVAVNEKLEPTLDRLTSRIEDPVVRENSREPSLGNVFDAAVAARVPQEPAYLALAQRCRELVAPGFADAPSFSGKRFEGDNDLAALADYRQCVLLAKCPFRNANFFAGVAELVHEKSAPDVVARARKLPGLLKASANDRVLRLELVLLVLNHPDLLDDAEVNAAAIEAVRQPPDEMWLLPELGQSGPIGDRYRAVVEVTAEAKRHPFFWAALAMEQLHDTERACSILDGIFPATPESTDLIAAYLSGENSFDSLYQYKAQLAALALPPEQRRFSKPRETLELIYPYLTRPFFDHAAESDAVRLARETLEGSPTQPARAEALHRLVILQQQADAANIPNEKALEALETAAGKDADGAARSAFLEALRSSPAWSELSEERRLAGAKLTGGEMPGARFGTWERRLKGWHLLIPSAVKQENWAVEALKTLSLREARDQLRNLITSDFGDSFHEGNLLLQAFLATRRVTSTAEWLKELAALEPSQDARRLTTALVVGATEAWTATEGTTEGDSIARENEACVDCLIGATESIYHRVLISGFDEDDLPVNRWGQKEVYEALATLGPKLKAPAAWSEKELGRFSPACLTALFAEHWEFLSRQPRGVVLARAAEQIPLEELILGADSLMRVRPDDDNSTLLSAHDYHFGSELLQKALEKVPNGSLLAKKMANEEMGPLEVLAKLRELKVLRKSS